MDDTPQLVYSAANLQQAYLLCDMLIDEGITASIANEALGGAIGELPVGAATAPQVFVPSAEFQTARQLTLRWEAKSRQDNTGDLAVEQPWEPPWPICPTCNQRRLTCCPDCKTAGDDFRHADRIGPISEIFTTKDNRRDNQQTKPRLLLLCPICEHAFEPAFYRNCATCNHDFGEGVVVEDAPLDAISERGVAWSIGITAIAVGVGILYWFLWQ